MVHNEHYRRYCEKKCRPHDLDSFQEFLKEIGTHVLSFQPPTERVLGNIVSYRQVPMGSCIRLHQPDNYFEVVAAKLYPEEHGRPRRTSSCSIV
jgi:hypothetical protein